MKIDFTPFHNGEKKIIDIAAQYTLDDLKQAANASIDWILDAIKDLDDAAITFNPVDPDAHDPYAVSGEEHIGWNLGHLVAHVTASTEEWATYSSILARGNEYPAEPRLRYETPWRDITTKAQAVQRLEESRRMRLAYLETWPDQPHLDVKRELSPRFIEKIGEMNAPAALLFGLKHEYDHYDQILDVAEQARAASREAART